jgi:hypothetical protein
MFIVLSELITIEALRLSKRSASTPNTGPKITIGKHPEHGPENHSRRKLRERNHADPEFRTGYLPGEPPKRDTVYPQAVQRYRAADQVDEEVATG